MLRGGLAESDYKPQFSGHSTFPLRYGWLKKAYDAVLAKNDKPDSKSIFLNDDAIANFGVGRNMVESMRHWAQVSGVIKVGSTDNSLSTTAFGKTLFDDVGLDPYMENASSLWLVHWKLCSSTNKTTWHWAFNHFASATFEREQLVRGLSKLNSDAAWKRISQNTIKRDVDCFVRTYVARPIRNKEAHEDALECPLVELGLIRSIGARDGFRFVHGPKTSLGNGVFLHALMDFWGNYPNATTLSLEAIVHEAGSPGRVFMLDENDIANRLARLGDETGQKIKWSETAGLKQVVREVDFSKEDLLEIIKIDYEHSQSREAAE